MYLENVRNRIGQVYRGYERCNTGTRVLKTSKAVKTI